MVGKSVNQETESPNVRKLVLSLKKLILFNSLVFMAFGNSWSNTASSTFLTMPANARQVFMGSAADLQDIDGIFVNPAATTHESSFSPYDWQAQSTAYEIAGLAQYANLAFTKTISPQLGSYGFGFVYFGNPDIPVIDESGSDQGNANVFDLSLLANYSRTLPLKIVAGANLKILHNKLYYNSDSNIALDLGLKRRFIVSKNSLWVSVSGNNLGPKTQFAEKEGLSESQAQNNSTLSSSTLPAIIYLSSSYSLKSFLPYGWDISLGPQFEYIVNDLFIFGSGIKVQRDFKAISIFFGGRYQNGLALGSWATGGGLAYKFRNVLSDLSFGFISYGDFSDSLVISAKISYLIDNSKAGKIKKELQLPKLPVLTKNAAQWLKNAKLTIGQHARQGKELPKTRAELAILLEEQGYGEPSFDGKVVYLPTLKSIIFISNRPILKKPHSITSVDDSEVNGKIVRVKNKSIIMQTSFGEVEIPFKSIRKINDKQIK